MFFALTTLATVASKVLLAANIASIAGGCLMTIGSVIDNQDD